MHIGFVGAGNMAMALAGAIVSARPETTILAFDPDPDRISSFGSHLDRFEPARDNAEVTSRSDVTFLAVKPQVMEHVCREISESTGLIVSIAAGIPIATIESYVPAGRIIRVMPNTPGLVGEMAAGYSRGSRATAEDAVLVGELLSEAGVAVEIEEHLLDAVTGLSGSGPAFVARIIEAFTEAGVADGLPEDIARTLTLATFSGTARLLEEKNLSVEDLVTMVSSPGGTTIAGRRVLEASGFKDIIRRTVQTATARSKELGT